MEDIEEDEREQRLHDARMARKAAEAAELARLKSINADLLAACEQANECLSNLMKAVPWGQTFDLDIAALNKSLLSLPQAIAKARGQ